MGGVASRHLGTKDGDPRKKSSREKQSDREALGSSLTGMVRAMAIENVPAGALHFHAHDLSAFLTLWLLLSQWLRALRISLKCGSEAPNRLYSSGLPKQRTGSEGICLKSPGNISCFQTLNTSPTVTRTTELIALRSLQFECRTRNACTSSLLFQAPSFCTLNPCPYLGSMLQAEIPAGRRLHSLDRGMPLRLPLLQREVLLGRL